jgi:hypothetical protein
MLEMESGRGKTQHGPHRGTLQSTIHRHTASDQNASGRSSGTIDVAR